MFSWSDYYTALNDFNRKPANVLVPVVLFVLLIPGLLVNVEVNPAADFFFNVEYGMLAQGVSSVDALLSASIPSVSVNAVLVHAVVFCAVYFALRGRFAMYY